MPDKKNPKLPKPERIGKPKGYKDGGYVPYENIAAFNDAKLNIAYDGRNTFPLMMPLHLMYDLPDTTAEMKKAFDDKMKIMLESKRLDKLQINPDGTARKYRVDADGNTRVICWHGYLPDCSSPGTDCIHVTYLGDHLCDDDKKVFGYDGSCWPDGGPADHGDCTSGDYISPNWTENSVQCTTNDECSTALEEKWKCKLGSMNMDSTFQEIEYNETFINFKYGWLQGTGWHFYDNDNCPANTTSCSDGAYCCWSGAGTGYYQKYWSSSCNTTCAECSFFDCDADPAECQSHYGQKYTRYLNNNGLPLGEDTANASFDSDVGDTAQSTFGCMDPDACNYDDAALHGVGWNSPYHMSDPSGFGVLLEQEWYDHRCTYFSGGALECNCAGELYDCSGDCGGDLTHEDGCDGMCGSTKEFDICGMCDGGDATSTTCEGAGLGDCEPDTTCCTTDPDDGVGGDGICSEICELPTSRDCGGTDCGGTTALCCDDPGTCGCDNVCGSDLDCGGCDNACGTTHTYDVCGYCNGSAVTTTCGVGDGTSTWPDCEPDTVCCISVGDEDPAPEGVCSVICETTVETNCSAGGTTAQCCAETDTTCDCSDECGGDLVLSGCDNACNSTADYDACGNCGGSTATTTCASASCEPDTVCCVAVGSESPAPEGVCSVICEMPTSRDCGGSACGGTTALCCDNPGTCGCDNVCGSDLDCGGCDNACGTTHTYDVCGYCNGSNVAITCLAAELGGCEDATLCCSAVDVVLEADYGTCAAECEIPTSRDCVNGTTADCCDADGACDCSDVCGGGDLLGGCDNECGTTHTYDACGVCDGSTTTTQCFSQGLGDCEPSTNCCVVVGDINETEVEGTCAAICEELTELDCAGGGTADCCIETNDACDCTNTCGGYALLDDCGCCYGGSTTPSTTCNNGSTDIVCGGSGACDENWAQDCNGDCWGTAYYTCTDACDGIECPGNVCCYGGTTNSCDECGICEGAGLNDCGSIDAPDSIQEKCACNDGTQYECNQCGVCVQTSAASGGYWDKETDGGCSQYGLIGDTGYGGVDYDDDANCTCCTDCCDCDGVCGGYAYIDNCGNCVGGDTGASPCIPDCHGDWGGSAGCVNYFYDEDADGIGSGGSTQYCDSGYGSCDNNVCTPEPDADPGGNVDLTNWPTCALPPETCANGTQGWCLEGTDTYPDCSCSADEYLECFSSCQVCNGDNQECTDSCGAVNPCTWGADWELCPQWNENCTDDCGQINPCNIKHWAIVSGGTGLYYDITPDGCALNDTDIGNCIEKTGHQDCTKLDTAANGKWWNDVCTDDCACSDVNPCNVFEAPYDECTNDDDGWNYCCRDACGIVNGTNDADPEQCSHYGLSSDSDNQYTYAPQWCCALDTPCMTGSWNPDGGECDWVADELEGRGPCDTTWCSYVDICGQQVIASLFDSWDWTIFDSAANGGYGNWGSLDCSGVCIMGSSGSVSGDAYYDKCGFCICPNNVCADCPENADGAPFDSCGPDQLLSDPQPYTCDSSNIPTGSTGNHGYGGWLDCAGACCGGKTYDGTDHAEIDKCGDCYCIGGCVADVNECVTDNVGWPDGIGGWNNNNCQDGEEAFVDTCDRCQWCWSSENEDVDGLGAIICNDSDVLDGAENPYYELVFSLADPLCLHILNGEGAEEADASQLGDDYPCVCTCDICTTSSSCESYGYCCGESGELPGGGGFCDCYGNTLDICYNCTGTWPSDSVPITEADKLACDESGSQPYTYNDAGDPGEYNKMCECPAGYVDDPYSGGGTLWPRCDFCGGGGDCGVFTDEIVLPSNWDEASDVIGAYPYEGSDRNACMQCKHWKGNNCVPTIDEESSELYSNCMKNTVDGQASGEWEENGYEDCLGCFGECNDEAGKDDDTWDPQNEDESGCIDAAAGYLFPSSICPDTVKVDWDTCEDCKLGKAHPIWYNYDDPDLGACDYLKPTAELCCTNEDDYPEIDCGPVGALDSEGVLCTNLSIKTCESTGGECKRWGITDWSATTCGDCITDYAWKFKCNYSSRCADDGLMDVRDGTPGESETWSRTYYDNNAPYDAYPGVKACNYDQRCSQRPFIEQCKFNYLPPGCIYDTCCAGDPDMISLWYFCLPINETTSIVADTDGEITGHFGYQLKYLDNLEYVSLTNCAITDIFGSTSAFYSELLGSSQYEKLTHLDLNHNQIGGEIPSQFGYFDSLEYLDLSHNMIEDDMPTTLCIDTGTGANLSTLTHFDLSYNNIDSRIRGCVDNWELLEYYDVSNNIIDTLAINQWDKLSNMIYFDISNNQITGDIDPNICDMVNNGVLQTLKLENNHFCPPYPNCGNGDITNAGEQDISGEYCPDISCGDLGQIECYDGSCADFECDAEDGQEGSYCGGGCTDDTACNYDSDIPPACSENESCDYPAENHDCQGNCIVEVDCMGECGGPCELHDYCFDYDGDGLGAGNGTPTCDCNVPDGWVNNCDDDDDNCFSNEHDCFGVCDGTAVIDECGDCGGDGAQWPCWNENTYCLPSQCPQPECDAEEVSNLICYTYEMCLIDYADDWPNDDPTYCDTLLVGGVCLADPPYSASIFAGIQTPYYCTDDLADSEIWFACRVVGDCPLYSRMKKPNRPKPPRPLPSGG